MEKKERGIQYWNELRCSPPHRIELYLTEMNDTGRERNGPTRDDGTFSYFTCSAPLCVHQVLSIHAQPTASRQYFMWNDDYYYAQWW